MDRDAASYWIPAFAGLTAVCVAPLVEQPGNLPPQPFRLARQLDGLDLLELDRALLDEVVQVAVGRAGYLGAIEIDLERAAMVLVGPGGRIADPFHAGGHPISLLVEALGDVVAARAAVLDGPVDGFLHVERGADTGDV